MMQVTILTVGKLKEAFYIQGVEEYSKRLKGYCKCQIIQLKEEALSQNPSQKEILQALEKEASRIQEKIPPRATVIPLCVEGTLISSEEMSSLLADCQHQGSGQIVFLIGGSYGLSDSIKQQGKKSISMSKMTFPHHLARVMLLEQIYRGFKIQEGSSYHK